jgi:hypothetical protein
MTLQCDHSGRFFNSAEYSPMNNKATMSYPTTAQPSIKRRHIDGPVLVLRDGRMRWLTVWERMLLALNMTDAERLERKHW